MSNIYVESILKVSHGARFSISFQNRSLKIDGKYIIKNGEYEGYLGLDKIFTPLPRIAVLYDRYQHSVPSERSDKKRKKYFQALPLDSLSDEDMLYGERREVAQIELELFVLIMILNGSLVWDDFAKDKWFWQCPNNKALILLKEWFNL